ncbi:MAG: hypothetical protein Q8O61_09760 [Nocardioides sp.]|nr:hypothetical protein [Nocardioides sp.]
MTPDEVAEYAATLPGCRRKGTAERPAWYVDNRLVVRLEDATTLTIRATPSARDALVAAHPETFGVPPAMEAHYKVQAVLDHGNDDAVRAAIAAAYEYQRAGHG